MIISLQSFAFTCNTDCGKAAKFKYPCPTFSNPGRKCTGKNPGLYASCEVDKKVSCDLWENAVKFFTDKVKPSLSLHYNANTYAYTENKEEYIIECVAAATASIATIGAIFAGPWGALATGAPGLFISKRICIQSTKW